MVSKRVIVRIAETPLHTPSQRSSTPVPIGVTGLHHDRITSWEGWAFAGGIRKTEFDAPGAPERRVADALARRGLIVLEDRQTPFIGAVMQVLPGLHEMTLADASGASLTCKAPAYMSDHTVSLTASVVEFAVEYNTRTGARVFSAVFDDGTGDNGLRLHCRADDLSETQHALKEAFRGRALVRVTLTIANVDD
mgnify:CR=1 FL=1